MTRVEYLRECCRQRGIAIKKIESDLGFANGYLNPKKLRKFPIDKAIQIAEYLKIDVFDLLEDDDTQKLLSMNTTADKNAVRVPVLGRVAAGIPINAIEEVLEWEELPAYAVKGDAYFGLLVKGDSMQPGIADGDIVIVKEQPNAEDGQVVVALINGHDAACKRLKKYPDGRIALLSDNPAYPPMYFDNAEIDTVPVKILGIVKELRRRF